VSIPNWGDVHRKGQLAHESFHVFSPAKQPEATYLDEGLATLNAKQSQNYNPHPNSKYHEALSLVEDLIATCSDSIRELVSVLASDIIAVCKKFHSDKAYLLVRKFYA